MRISAFEQIYRQHYAAVYRYALVLAGDAHKAEDLTQETFAKALTSLDESRSIAAWLHVVCRNLWIDQCRRDKRLRYMSRNALEQKLDAGMQGGPQDEKTHDMGISRLPPAMREALLLFYDAGFSCAEIARLQHTTPGAIRTLLYRARIQLKKIWEDEQDEFQ